MGEKMQSQQLIVEGLSDECIFFYSHPIQNHVPVFLLSSVFTTVTFSFRLTSSLLSSASCVCGCSYGFEQGDVPEMEISLAFNLVRPFSQFRQ